MARFCDLPAPLIERIAQHVRGRDGGLSLLSVCRYLRSFAEKAIYRTIELNFSGRPNPNCGLHYLIRTLLVRPDLAASTEHLSINCESDQVVLSSDAKDIDRTFIRNLKLDDHDEQNWLSALDCDVTDLYAALIVLLVPNVIDLTLQVLDRFYFTPQVINPSFPFFPSGPNISGSLKTLKYGSGLRTDETEVMQEAYPMRHITLLFYHPHLTKLDVTGVGGGTLSWPTPNRPASNIRHFSIHGPWSELPVLEEYLAASPQAESVEVFADDRENSKLTVYGDFGRALQKVNSTRL